MSEEIFESYVYQIMQYVKYKENEPYIESILDNMRYTLFREDREYIKDLQQENKQLKERYETLKQEHIDTINRNEEKQQRIDKAIEYIKNKQEDINNGGNDMSYRQLTALLEILGGNNGKIN